jgi:Putative zinc-finger
MKCVEAKSLLSPYFDGAVTGKQMHLIHTHLENCSPCEREYRALVRTQQLLAGLGRKKAPADLALKLRLAISRESESAKRGRLQGWNVRLENALRAFMVPATAGMITAVAFFGFFMGFLTIPELEARSHNDIPLMLHTGPELQDSSFGMTLSPINEDSVVIEAYVDANGRVQDYRILSDPDEGKDLNPQVKNMLIFTTFRPAMSMGRPTPGRAVLSFSKVSVRG